MVLLEARKGYGAISSGSCSRWHLREEHCTEYGVVTALAQALLQGPAWHQVGHTEAGQIHSPLAMMSTVRPVSSGESRQEGSREGNHADCPGTMSPAIFAKA